MIYKYATGRFEFLTTLELFAVQADSTTSSKAADSTHGSHCLAPCCQQAGLPALHCTTSIASIRPPAWISIHRVNSQADDSSTRQVSAAWLLAAGMHGLHSALPCLASFAASNNNTRYDSFGSGPRPGAPFIHIGHDTARDGYACLEIQIICIHIRQKR